MPTMFAEHDRRQILGRLDRLRPEARPRWGRMNASQMLAHLTDATRMALGDLPVGAARTPRILRYPPFKQLILYVLPFPKGAPTAREIVARTADDWDAEQQTIRALIQRLADAPEDYAWAEHVVFGRLTRKEWGVLGYKHFDHHLRQFGM